MLKKMTALAFTVFLASSCSFFFVNSEETTDEFYPQKPVEHVVYLETVDQPFKEIGVVIVNSERKQRNFEEVLSKMKREAALIGGDAITNIKTDASGAWKKLPAQNKIGNAYIRANYSATVILFE